MMKALPLAIENFPDLIRQGGYYVDKTAFIQPLMTEGKTVRLITRPHCFLRPRTFRRHGFWKTLRPKAGRR